jgi:GNAT superfamily N-acetyltransferase
MELRDYQIGDESKILELFQVVFKQELSLENWLWRFRYNPAGKHMIKLMWDNDKLIGHYAVSPVMMSVDGDHILTAHSLTTMTHPDYGGRGIFKKLSNALYDELENELDCKAIWGFPNNNSHYGFIKNLGWTNLAVLHTLGVKFDNLKTKGFDFNTRLLNKFDDTHVAFINKKISNFDKVYINKSKTYLNWRFIEKPKSNYICYEFYTNSTKAILIAKPYLLKNQDNYDLNIIDCYMDNYEEIPDYIYHIANNLGLEFDRVTIWKSIFDPDHLQLERQGFSPALPQTYLAARIQSNMSKSFSEFKNWNISMSDSDVF